jgi:signal transduction histidine kinase/ActR/RegA family two-component response regulator
MVEPGGLVREIDVLQYQLGQTAAAIAGRVAQLSEALHHLAGITSLVVEEHGASVEQVDAWIDEHFVRDPDGYFGRREVLDLARAGQTDLDHFVFYVHHRFADDPDVRRRMHAMRNLGPRLRAVRERLADVEWVYYQDARGWAVSYPMHDPSPTIPADFDWLGYLTFQSVEPSNNPEGRIRWTPPNVDYGGTGIMVACSVPLFHTDGRFFGVWSVDVPVQSLLRDVVLETMVEGQSNFIVDADGYLVAHEVLEKVISGEKGAWVRQPMSSLGEAFGEIDLHALRAAGATQLELEADDGSRRVVLARALPEVDWVLFVTFPAAGVLDAVKRSFEEAFAHLRLGDTTYRIDSDVTEDLRGLVDGYNDMAGELQRTLEAQERMRSEAEHGRKLQVVGQLAGGVAHDFNNLLTIILGSASLLEEEVGPDQVDLVRTILTATEAAGTLTRQMLSLSRGDLVQPQVVSVGSVVRQAARLLEHLCPSTVHVRCDVPDRTPSVHIDPSQLLQVVLNLGINARDAVGAEGTVELGVREREGEVAVRVRDDGAGMDAATAECIFKPFFTTRSTGSGLGLATVDRIVKAAGGTVELDTAVGRGTTFDVWLPSRDTQRAAITDTSALRGCRVLLVDDEAMVRRFAVQALQRFGAAVFPAASADEALSLVDARRFDLLLTDVVLPGPGGRELAEAVVRRQPDIEVVFMSGFSDDEMLQRGVRAAEVHFLAKPFTAEQLGQLLAGVCAGTTGACTSSTG